MMIFIGVTLLLWAAIRLLRSFVAAYLGVWEPEEWSNGAPSGHYVDLTFLIGGGGILCLLGQLAG